MSYEDNIKKLNIILPEAKDPVGKYVATKIINNLLYISGQISISEKGELIKDIIKPEICDELRPTDKSRNEWYTEENRQKHRASQFREKLEHTAASKRVKAFQRETVRDFKKTFSNLNNRDPMDDEVVGNLEDVIDPDVVRDILRHEATVAIELGSLSSSSTEGGMISSV